MLASPFTLSILPFTSPVSLICFPSQQIGPHQHWNNHFYCMETIRKIITTVKIQSKVISDTFIRWQWTSKKLTSHDYHNIANIYFYDFGTIQRLLWPSAMRYFLCVFVLCSLVPHQSDSSLLGNAIESVLNKIKQGDLLLLWGQESNRKHFVSIPCLLSPESECLLRRCWLLQDRRRFLPSHFSTNITASAWPKENGSGICSIHTDRQRGSNPWQK